MLMETLCSSFVLLHLELIMRINGDFDDFSMGECE